MKKIISFEKELDFPSMIGDITSISLDHTIEFTDPSSASGKFIVSGTYKMTEASTLNEKFNYDIPVDITLTEKLDLDSCRVSISDFNYEIINDDILKCKIDLLLEGIEEIILEEEVEAVDEIDSNDDDVFRECDGDVNREENEIELLETDIVDNNSEEKNVDESVEVVNNMKKQDYDLKDANIGSLFQVFENSLETFKAYSVYIMRREDTLEKVLDTYKISREQLSEYNDLGNIEVGSKIIIPSTNE